MMTMISAFMVKITPIEALKVKKVEISAPPQAVSAPPSAKAKAAAAGDVDADEAARRSGRPRRRGPRCPARVR